MQYPVDVEKIRSRGQNNKQKTYLLRILTVFTRILSARKLWNCSEPYGRLSEKSLIESIGSINLAGKSQKASMKLKMMYIDRKACRTTTTVFPNGVANFLLVIGLFFTFIYFHKWSSTPTRHEVLDLCRRHSNDHSRKKAKKNSKG